MGSARRKRKESCSALDKEKDFSPEEIKMSSQHYGRDEARKGFLEHAQSPNTSGQEIRTWPLIIVEPRNVIFAAIFVSAGRSIPGVRSRTLPKEKTR